MQEFISQYPIWFLWLLVYCSMIALRLTLLANTYKLKTNLNIFVGLNVRLRAGVCFICDLGIFSLHIPEFFPLLSNPVAPSLWDIDLFQIKVIIAIFPE